MNLKLTDYGPSIRELQELLNRHYGATVLTPDGIFGPLTEEAVIAFQREHGLTPDGIAGPKTLTALRCSHAQCPSPQPALPKMVNGCPIVRSARTIRHLVIHCTASREGRNLTVAQIRHTHMSERGWTDIGYHYIVYLDGTIHAGRHVDRIGAHVSGYNTNSIGICYVGGLDGNGKAKDTRTPAQRSALRSLLAALRSLYPTAIISGHRDFSPDLNGNGTIEPREYIKQCPCFDAMVEYEKDFPQKDITPSLP